MNWRSAKVTIGRFDTRKWTTLDRVRIATDKFNVIKTQRIHRELSELISNFFFSKQTSITSSQRSTRKKNANIAVDESYCFRVNLGAFKFHFSLTNDRVRLERVKIE